MLKIQDVFGVELRMNRAPQEEYEEVESPFAAKSPEKSRLRTRKNVFNRPFSADPSVAPAVFETSARRSIGHPDHTDLIEHRTSDLAQTEIDYLEESPEEEEEEVVEKRPSKTSTSSRKKDKTKKNIVARVAWAAVGLLVLRLIFMDRGVWDYFATEKSIREQQDELRTIQKENKELRAEIERIQLDRNYQKQLAKEHLGVIAVDEFLILFAGESNESSSAEPVSNQL